MIEPKLIRRLQAEQHWHDVENHFDVVSLHRIDRLKHYALHYSKYAGRLARGEAEPKSTEQTLIDALLVCLSSANTLNQDISDAANTPPEVAGLEKLADAAGRFADACEKVDHLEDFIELAKSANIDVMRWIIGGLKFLKLDMPQLIEARREQLSQRQVYRRIQP